MKKYFNLVVTALVMCAAFSMTSCSKDDDDIINDKPVEEPKPVRDELKIYDAIITKDLLTYYDVTLQLSNDEKTKEVTLSTANCEEADLFSNNALEFAVYDIDGVRGVKSVKATVTPKDHVEHMLAETKTKVSLWAKAWLLDSYYYPTEGKWEVSILPQALLPNKEPLVLDPSALLSEDFNGEKLYNNLAETFTILLSYNY